MFGENPRRPLEIGKELTLTLQNSETASATEKPRHGGKRAGAGRPKGSSHLDPLMRRVVVSVRLPQWIADWLKDQPVPAGRIIEIALEDWGLKLTKLGGD